MKMFALFLNLLFVMNVYAHHDNAEYLDPYKPGYHIYFGPTNIKLYIAIELSYIDSLHMCN